MSAQKQKSQGVVIRLRAHGKLNKVKEIVEIGIWRRNDQPPLLFIF